MFEIFDLYYKDYDKWFETKGKIIFEIEKKAFEKILPYIKKPSLEIGVGSGRFAEYLKIDFGIDPSIKLLKIAKNRNIKVFKAKGENLPFKDNFFFTIFLIVTICFIDNLSEVFNEIKRVLKNGGYLVIGFVPKESPWGQLYIKKASEGHRFYKYAKFYSFQEVKKILEENNFKIVKIISTLSQKPSDDLKYEEPSENYNKNAGFIIILSKFTKH